MGGGPAMTLEDLMEAPFKRGRIIVGHRVYWVEYKGLFVLTDCFAQTIAFESLGTVREFLETLLYVPNPQELFDRVAPKLRGAAQFMT
jgi:hypothetical protein